MPVTENFDLNAGDDKVLEFTVSDDDDVSLAGATVHWKLSKTPDHEPLIHKFSPGDGAEITSAENRTFEVTIDRADTADLHGKFYHQAQVEDPDGKFQTVTVGIVSIRKTV